MLLRAAGLPYKAPFKGHVPQQEPTPEEGDPSLRKTMEFCYSYTNGLGASWLAEMPPFLCGGGRGCQAPTHLPFCAGTKPQKSSPSSVRVPVCKRQTRACPGPHSRPLFGLRVGGRWGNGYLIEAHQVQLATNVDALRTDREDLLPTQAPLGIHHPSRHGSRQRRGHRDG